MDCSTAGAGYFICPTQRGHIGLNAIAAPAAGVRQLVGIVEHAREFSPCGFATEIATALDGARRRGPGAQIALTKKKAQQLSTLARNTA